MDKDKLRAKIDHHMLSGEISEEPSAPEAGGKKYLEELGVDPVWATTSLSSATDDTGTHSSPLSILDSLALSHFSCSIPQHGRDDGRHVCDFLWQVNQHCE